MEQQELLETAAVVSSKHHDEVKEMKTSLIQDWIDEGLEKGESLGRLREARAIVLRVGTRKFGAPAEGVVSQLDAENSPERLEDLADRLLDVGSWEELLGI